MVELAALWRNALAAASTQGITTLWQVLPEGRLPLHVELPSAAIEETCSRSFQSQGAPVRKMRMSPGSSPLCMSAAV